MASICYFTLRDIPSDEELVADYHYEDSPRKNGEWPFVCKCGTKKCRDPARKKKKNKQENANEETNQTVTETEMTATFTATASLSSLSSLPVSSSSSSSSSTSSPVPSPSIDVPLASVDTLAVSCSSSFSTTTTAAAAATSIAHELVDGRDEQSDYQGKNRLFANDESMGDKMKVDDDDDDDDDLAIISATSSSSVAHVAATPINRVRTYRELFTINAHHALKRTVLERNASAPSLSATYAGSSLLIRNKPTTPPPATATTMSSSSVLSSDSVPVPVVSVPCSVVDPLCALAALSTNRFAVHSTPAEEVENSLILIDQIEE